MKQTMERPDFPETVAEQAPRPIGLTFSALVAGALGLATLFALYLRPGFVVAFANLIFLCR